MYPNYIDKLNRQKEEIENMIRSYQQMTPVNNFINTNQTPPKELIEWRILNESEGYTNGQFTIQNTKCLNPRGTEG